MMMTTATVTNSAPEDKLTITGQHPLQGEVTISGAKNSVLKLMAAALLSEEAMVLRNVPQLADVEVMAQVLEALGRKVSWHTLPTPQQAGVLCIAAGHVATCEAPYPLVSKMRASFNVLGALLGRYGQARVPFPGGCSIGKRGVDQHIKGLQLLGAQLAMEHGIVDAKALHLKGARITLDMPSVGATENILLASVLAEGTTVLSNAAQEPEIVDLANCLNQMGACISGAGTHEVVIEGVGRRALKGVDYTVMPDRIEAATYMAAVAAAGGQAVLHNVCLAHMAAVVAKLEDMGVVITPLNERSVTVSRDEALRLKPTSLLTTYYPGFPTDMQAPLMSLMAVADGVSMVNETIYENRFKHVGELNRMGANIQAQNEMAVVTGVPQLSGAEVQAHDLRAGAAMVVAALGAEGTSAIYNLHHLDRGYAHLECKLQALGALVERSPLNEVEARPASHAV
jgi:UDP-N-acetylglucosamine 1-carboxyvinyltransferase